MTDDPWASWVARERCREKTGRGNLYHRKIDAKRAAAAMRADTGDAGIHLFRCPACRWWHLGGDNGRGGRGDG